MPAKYKGAIISDNVKIYKTCALAGVNTFLYWINATFVEAHVPEATDRGAQNKRPACASRASSARRAEHTSQRSARARSR
jgi:hypothetical protein